MKEDYVVVITKTDTTEFIIKRNLSKDEAYKVYEDLERVYSNCHVQIEVFVLLFANY